MAGRQVGEREISGRRACACMRVCMVSKAGRQNSLPKSEKKFPHGYKTRLKLAMAAGADIASSQMQACERERQRGSLPLPSRQNTHTCTEERERDQTHGQHRQVGWWRDLGTGVQAGAGYPPPSRVVACHKETGRQGGRRCAWQEVCRHHCHRGASVCMGDRKA